MGVSRTHFEGKSNYYSSVVDLPLSTASLGLKAEPIYLEIKPLLLETLVYEQKITFPFNR